MGKLSPVNPRGYLPSNAHPEHRSARKELEKQHPFGWTEPLILGMLGVGLAWNIEKQVQKHEERKDKEEQEQKEREERRRRRREQQIRSGTLDPRAQDNGSQSSRGRRGSRAPTGAGGNGSERGSDRSVARDTVDMQKDRRSRRDRVQSVDMGRHENPRYIEDDRYYEQQRYDRGRGDERYGDDRYADDRYADARYDDRTTRDRDPSAHYYRGRSRRDSW
ncbi:hypothetical protein F4821DRAFT_252579 [Hypoxylon rubiginosum]|uniref:Uncharacterized protein n=1 Tax=Hypoxylon rubiginosum TaxID=110542 RepID=A0ACC0DLA2_9PEZI|nr:hypothetical protein F4821DRAFT_252579 [Hypoxylon rubiginosum]